MLIKLHILSEYQVSKLFIIPSKFHFWLKKSFKLDFLRMAKTDLTGFRVAPSNFYHFVWRQAVPLIEIVKF